MKCGTKTKAAFAKQSEGRLPKRIGWWSDSQLAMPGMTRTATRDVFRAMFVMADWRLPLDFYRTRYARTATIVLSLGPRDEFDFAGTTLALADVRNLRDPEPRDIWFSPFINWSGNRAGESEIYLLNVGLHEIGHTIGFGHSKRGLLSEYYDPDVVVPSKAEMGSFYREYPELKAA